MADTKLKSFKIADTRRPSVAGASKKTSESDDTTAASEAHSLGFKRIEGVLETEEPAAVRSSLARTLAQLKDLEKKSSAHKDKAAAKKAILAVNRTSELMDYLFETKASMQSGDGK